MDKDAQQIIAVGLLCLLVALGFGGCTWMAGHGMKLRSEALVMKYGNGIGGK